MLQPAGSLSAVHTVFAKHSEEFPFTSCLGRTHVTLTFLGNMEKRYCYSILEKDEMLKIIQESLVDEAAGDE